MHVHSLLNVSKVRTLAVISFHSVLFHDFQIQIVQLPIQFYIRRVQMQKPLKATFVKNERMMVSECSSHNYSVS